MKDAWYYYRIVWPIRIVQWFIIWVHGSKNWKFVHDFVFYTLMQTIDSDFHRIWMLGFLSRAVTHDNLMQTTH